MSQETSTAIVPQLVDISVNLDKEDVAAILMSRAETHLKKQISEHKEAEKTLTAELEGLDKALDEQLQAVAEGFFATASNTLKEAASALKAKNVKVAITHNGHSLKGNTKQRIVHCDMVVTGDRPHIKWMVNQPAPMSAEAKDALQATEAKRKEIADNNRAWMDLRRKLADLPSMERRAKAAIAEQRLQASSEGREMIEMLDGQLDDSIKLLGVS